MTQEDKNRIDQLLNTCNKLEKEMKEMKRGIDFLIQEYKNNKRYFSESGKPSIEDVIRTSFEFGWTLRHNFSS